MTFFTFRAQSIPSTTTPPNPYQAFIILCLEVWKSGNAPHEGSAIMYWSLEKYVNSSPMGQDQNNNMFVQ